MLIDSSSVKCLELLSSSTGDQAKSLFGILDFTKTSAGSRLLRANILQPPSDLATIRMRQDCVTELLANERMYFDAVNILPSFLDMDHLVSLLVHIPKNISSASKNRVKLIIYMKQNLELLPKLAEAVGGAQNQLLVSICNNFTDPRISAIYSKIARTINESTTYAKNPAHMVTQQCFAVHPGIDGLLDVARQTYVETVEGSSIFVFRESSFDQIFMNWSIPTPVNTDSNLKLPTLRKRDII